MSRQLVIDANLLVLLVVGTAGREFIARHKRLTTFTAQDYDGLCALVAQASSVLVTPNVLTETSNLARHIAEPARSKVMAVLFEVITKSVDENYISSSAAAARPEFLRLGLTDSALLEATQDDAELLTADLDLYVAAMQAKRHATNFNHLREAWL